MATTQIDRPGARAQLRYLRVSATKVRVVLDLIRGLPVAEASRVLALSERGVSREVSKVLDSAVANAEHNEEIPGSELFVSACWADEGPTLKRFRPRARGRAGRINKRTSHLTIVVSRLTDDELDAARSKAEAKGAAQTDAADARRRRVAASREADDVTEAEETTEDVVDGADEIVDTTEAAVADAEATETEVVTPDEVEADAADESDEAATDEAVADDADESDEAAAEGDDADADEETN